MMCWFCVRVPG